MTNRNIPLCYNTTAGTKINERDNYNIDGNTFIGDSSLNERNDEYRKDTTTLYYINGNTYTSLQTHITPSAVDPRCARMTNRNIPLCYNTTAGTKIHERDNYNIHGNTHIGDSSLCARNDEQHKAIKKENKAIGIENTSIRIEILPIEIENISIEREILPIRIEIVPIRIENTSIERKIIPIRTEINPIGIEILSTPNEKMLKEMRRMLNKCKIIDILHNFTTTINAPRSRGKNGDHEAQTYHCPIQAVYSNGGIHPCYEAQAYHCPIQATETKITNVITISEDYNINPSLRSQTTPSRAEIPDQERYDELLTYLYAITTTGTKTHNRANYNIDRNTRIGDSSLYARNDEYYNVTDREGRFGKLSDPGDHSNTRHSNATDCEGRFGCFDKLSNHSDPGHANL